MPSRRDLAAVTAVVLAAGFCLWGKPWHIDEPFFLAIARQILSDPRHPFAFAFNWYGQAEPMVALNNTPPLLGYFLAGALRLSGGGEFWTRALFFPFDLASAWGLLALAARFLKKPLWPVLIVLAGPAWTLNLQHVMAERVMAGFALPALWLFVMGVDEERDDAYWGSAVLAALALFSKYNALFIMLPALSFGWSRGVDRSRLAGWAALALCGGGLGVGWIYLAGGEALRAGSSVTTWAAQSFWSAPTHKARSLLAFTGGLGLVAAVWGAWLSPSRRAVLVAAAACAALFGPWFDLAPLVRPIDRLTGFLLSWGTVVSLWVLLHGPRTRGRALWAPWLAAVATLQLAYWCILARFVVFLLPPLIFWLWERLEFERPRALHLLGRAGFGAALALGLALGAVDWRYASAQKDAARFASSEFAAQGRRVWFTGHWGLQEYMNAVGARALDRGQGGWDVVRPMDVVVVPGMNTNILKPSRLIRARVIRSVADSPIPLRHMSGWTGEGGFYSNVGGFLPWSLSTEPVDTTTFVEAL